jgi:hypothetical protein
MIRVIGWVCVGFFIYYVVDSGGPRKALNNIAGEVYWNTMPEPIGVDIDKSMDRMRDSIDRIYEKIDKSVDNMQN